MTGHWWQAIPPIPISQSDLAVIGKVSSANAFLSANKSTVYSEFTIDVSAILKGRAEGYVVVEREGGYVRFPSGHVRALDGQGNLAFSRFDGQSADEFLAAVRRAIMAP